MTGLSYPERASGRHVDTSSVAGRLTRSFSAVGFVQWMVVVCLALVLWPSSFGGRFGLVMVAGTSMEPTYELGDAVIAWKESVEIGDIVLFLIPAGQHGEGNPVIHRVVGGDGNGWVTKGDNMVLPDEWTPANGDILGVAKMKIPLGGEILALMRNWLFIAVVGGLAAGLLLWPDYDDEGPKERRGRHLAR